MPDRPGEVLETLIDSIVLQRPRFDQDIVQLDAQIWAIHGYIPVDGEVLVAEFEDRETASSVLARLLAAQDGDIRVGRHLQSR